ncbi:MAG: hypothetical protein JSW02_01895 [candidate division WOR-3 bacterium]|nr:MAG: hypothetical protein JSW02_01895 [candidate division WOR-3 bacterium]
MGSKGIGGFGAIIIIIILLLFGYVIFTMARIHFDAANLGGKVETTAQIGPSMTSYDISQSLIKDAEEMHITVYPESIFIDREIIDSFRIYLAYDDSADVLGLFTYKRHFVIDKIVSTKVRM